MSTSSHPPPDPTLVRELEHKLRELVLRYGGVDTPELHGKTARCVAQMIDALSETSTDQRSLSPLDVVRIRASKFAATLTPAAVYRDPKQLAALRAEIHDIALSFVGGTGAEGSRFLPQRRN